MGYKKVNENLENIHNNIINSLGSLDNEKLWNIAETFYIWDNYIDLQKEYEEILKKYNERAENYDIEAENYKEKLIEYKKQIKEFKVTNEIQINNKTFITFGDYCKIKEKNLLEPVSTHLKGKEYYRIDRYFPFISEEEGLINLISLMGNKYPDIEYYYVYHNGESDSLFDMEDFGTNSMGHKPKFIIHNDTDNDHAVFNIIINKKVFNFDLRSKLQNDFTSCRSIALKLLEYYSNLYKNNKENFIETVERDANYLKSLIGREINLDIPEYFFRMLQSDSTQNKIIDIKEKLYENNNYDLQKALAFIEMKKNIAITKYNIKTNKNQKSKLEDELKSLETELEKFKNKELEEELNKKKEKSLELLEEELEKELNKKKEKTLELKKLNEELKKLKSELEKPGVNTKKINPKRLEIEKKELEIEKKEIEIEKEVLKKKADIYIYLINKSSNLSINTENLKYDIKKYKDIQQKYIKNIQQEKKSKDTKDTNISYLIDRLEHLLILKEIIDQNVIIPKDMFEKTVNKNGNYNIINFSRNSISNILEEKKSINSINIKNFNEKLEDIYRTQGKEKILELCEQNEYSELIKIMEEFLIKKELDDLSSKITEQNKIEKGEKNYNSLRKIEQITTNKEKLQNFHNILKSKGKILREIINSEKFTDVLELFEESEAIEKNGI